ncbi:nudix hydrolase 19, chloroplastic-like [Aristolochia californica]|uniref:nudix hydrolase 19, chloroplastic-like n=1 Tax=Aristolochia californica TaxID=171875 RepID=UPI0035E091D6
MLARLPLRFFAVVPIFPSICASSVVSRIRYSSTARRAMPLNLRPHAFSGNPLRSKALRLDPSSNSPFVTLKTLLLDDTLEQLSSNLKVLPFRKGRPLAFSSPSVTDTTPVWHLGWLNCHEFKNFLSKSEIPLREDSLVHLGSDAHSMSYWAVDITAVSDLGQPEVTGGKQSCFIQLSTLMVATDWANESAMEELAIAGHARALLEWHNTSLFCGHCGMATVPIDAGRRKQCSNEACKKRVYPRVDPVVIMLVIDKENDRVLLSHQSRFVPRMWTCLAGFIEPGESLEEAVRRETLEETGIEVGEVVYHSSQPWPVGPNNMPCQLMVGFFAYAKSLEIRVDKEELEDAQWHGREEVKKAVTFAEYEKAQRTAAVKVDQMCKGVETSQNFSSDFNVESGELAQMFFPGPFAIAHHLITSWVNESTKGLKSPKQATPTSTV